EIGVTIMYYSNGFNKTKYTAAFIIIIVSLILLSQTWLQYSPRRWNEDLRMQKIAKVHKMRLQHIHKMCQEHDVRKVGAGVQNNIFNVELSEGKHVIFCPIAKVGTTFFGRLFGILQMNQPIDDMYNMSVFAGSRYHKYQTFNEIEENVRRETPKMIFVRHPESRIVSAYLDKIYGIGAFRQRIPAYLKSVRPNNTEKSFICGSDVSFDLFLEIVLKDTRNGHGNRHWMPAYSRCFACSIDYDIIGKMETFNDDLQYAMHLAGYKDFPEVTTTNTAKLESIKREIEKLFRAHKNAKFPSPECSFTMGEGYDRVWSILKIHGLLNKNTIIPPSKTILGYIDNTTVAEVSKLVKNDPIFVRQYQKAEKDMQDYVLRMHKTQDPNGEKYNAIEYLFRNISEETKARLKEAYKYDYLLFGYE
ncbi:unnamed protein product, partial [Owenia fusiformis]